MHDDLNIAIENSFLRVEVAPTVGGRIVSLVHRPTGEEWLWRSPVLPLRKVPPGTLYDPEFYGGIDEQIPCDKPETIDGMAYPDHGELWTQPLSAEYSGAELVLRGMLPLLGFHYERRMELLPDRSELRVRYRIENRSGASRAFLWKLHAALAVAPGDRIECPASTAHPLDLAWSRCRDMGTFPWPCCGDLDMGVVPEQDGTTEFLALTDLSQGIVGLRRSRTGTALRLAFDRAVFPCCWFFAAYGKKSGQYTVVLEPATSSAYTVAEATKPARLGPGEVLETKVSYIIENNS